MSVVDEAAGLYATQQTRVRAYAVERVPAYVGSFELGAFKLGRKVLARAFEVSEAGRLLGFRGALKEPLQTYADSEEESATADGFAYGVRNAELLKQSSGAEVTYTGENDLCGVAD